jgi:hypothetical protein
METVLLVNEETGEEYVEERPKLAIPDVQFKSMNLRDEQVERQFISQLASQGFPVSLKTMAVNIPIDFKDEVEAKTEEKLQTVVAEQRFKKDLFERLIAMQLPIPPEYFQEFQAYMMQQENPEMVAQMAPQGIADITSQPAAPNILTPGSQSDADSMVGPFLMPGMIPPQRPEESDEQKASAPKKAAPKKTEKKKTDTKTTDDKKKIKKSSVNGSEYEYADDDEDRIFTHASQDNGYVAEYGGRMYFGVPKEQVLRRKMTIVKGMKIVTDNQYERFNLEDFEENYKVATAVGEDNKAADEAIQHGVADDGEASPGVTGAGLDFQDKDGKL